MSDVIRLLPDSVANQIAAGEVIQRPASVVKELVENAVDAGASIIQVIIKDAGRTLIQVVDNGCGMSDTDARLAFERHATSKITRADDLFALHTMGFRGEALASIAAVAQIDLRTSPHGADVGTRLIINGSEVESQMPEACSPGSNMMVKNLFFNVPVRRKFLKKDSVEMSNIVKEFERMALVNPAIELSLIHNDEIVYKLFGSSLKQRISALFGKALDKQLIPVSTATSLVKIDGFISRPEHSRKRGQLQFLMVNGRHMRHPYFHKAIISCYDRLIPADHQPNYFINFQVDPASIDVNIHPTKNEIKFENEAAIWQILSAAVREALGRFNAVPGIDFDSAGDAPDIPVFNPNEHGDHGIEIDTSYNPFAESATLSPRPAAHAPVPSRGISSDHSLRNTGTMQNWQQLYEGFMSPDPTTPAAPAASSRLNSMTAGPDDTRLATPSLITADDTPIDATAMLSPDEASIQVAGKYILTPTRSGLMAIDCHRAHTLVRYNDILADMALGEVRSQRVLFPEVLEISAAQATILRDIMPHIEAAGFELSFIGDNSWSINAVPMQMGDANPVDTLMRIIDEAAHETISDTPAINRSIALAMARNSAIKGGHTLSSGDREALIASLLKLPSPNFTPDGLPVIRIIDSDRIARLFD